MFTGIVEEMGRVAALETQEGNLHLVVHTSAVHEGARLGDSIAVNGVCLTVVAIGESPSSLAFDAVPETLQRTNLGQFAVGDRVNLERAATASTPMGGHYVQGHVDATGTVRRNERVEGALDVWFDAPTLLSRFIVEKGYITVDGASLTVVDVDADGFSVTLVPHTRENVVFGEGEPGRAVNLEVDVMAKYVERLLGPRLAAFETRLAALESGE
ncbi:MAG: riboflavin synthase [Sandaracinaceae bacterium]